MWYNIIVEMREMSTHYDRKEKRKMKIMVFDTETTSLEKPFCYNIGYVIFDTETKEILSKKDFVVEQVWHNSMLFSSAYYADKRQIYVSRLKGRTCTLDKFGYITQKMYRDIKEYGIEHAYAYNSSFDEKVFAFNCDWFKCINPFDTIAIHDIRGFVHKEIAFTADFQAFCDTYGLYTESGNYSTTAETLFQYISGDTEFVEEHTALADSMIELAILERCITDENWANDYPTYRTIAKRVVKDFVIIDSDGNTHKFPFTSKRKISGSEGYKLTFAK